jgi:hypothetical protein
MTDATGLLPVLSFGLFVAAIHRRVELDPAHDWRVSWLSGSVAWGLAVLLITELLNLAGLLSRAGILSCWLAITAGLAWVVFAPAERTRTGTSPPGPTPSRWRLDAPLDLVLIAVIAALVLTLAALAIVAPPNTWDSMTYHMGRVAHWAQNGSVNHYPTTITRQLYLGPWAEFAVLHFQLLAGSDRWANLVQWMAMVGSAVGASLIAGRLGAPRSAQLGAAAVTVAIPMGILQATSTQTDYVTAFWVTSFASYLLLIMDPAIGPRGRLVVLAGLALGLATLTKATALPFALPFALWLLAWATREQKRRRLALLFAMGTIAASLSIGHYWRNETTFGRPLGPRAEVDRYSNETRSPAAVTSNVIRNIGLHLPTPLSTVNRVSLRTIQRLHRLIGFDIDDPRTSYMWGQPPDQFDIGKPRYHEDLAGNFLHAALMGLAFGVMLVSPGDRAGIRRAYALALVAGFLLFSALLRWQPWGSRLQMPFFVLGAPLIAATFWRLLRPNAARAATLLVMVASLPWVLFNESRMLVPRPTRSVLWDRDAHTVFNTSRREMYFRNRPELAEPYEAAAAKVEAAGCHEVGLVVGLDDWEYPFWVLLNPSGGPPTHLSHDMPGAARDETPRYCAVIVTDGADIDPAVVPALRTRYQTEWTSTPFVTVFLAPRSPVGSAQAASR